MMHQPPRSFFEERDRAIGDERHFVRALVTSARIDAPRAGAKARALTRLEATVQGTSAGALRLASGLARTPPVPTLSSRSLSQHVTPLLGAAALAALIGWGFQMAARSADAAAGLTPTVAPRTPRKGGDTDECRASAEGSQPSPACRDDWQLGLRPFGNGSGRSFGGSSG